MSGVPSSAIGSFQIGISPIGGAPPTPGITQTISSYLFWEYRDLNIGPNGEEIFDPALDSLLSFIDAYNTLTQQYVNWFNQVILPDWTNKYVVGLLLDWVGKGLYDIARPVLPSGPAKIIGPPNTVTANMITPNTIDVIEAPVYYGTDDVYKRVMTWHLYKGDGKYFSVSWLKRRVLRFLLGVNGTDINVANTQRISVTFGPSFGVTIRLITVIGTFNSGALPNTRPANTVYPNQIQLSTVTLPQFAFGPILKAAVAAGVLELPYAFSWTVQLT